MRKDVDFNFIPHPLTGDLATKKDSSAIKQSLRNIVLTSFYERGFNIEFGTNLRYSMFENISPLEAQTIRDLISEGIENFEPQVELIDVVVQQSSNEHELNVVVVYTEFNNPNEQVVSIDIQRLR